MGKRSDVTDAVQRLDRSLKRTSAIWAGDSFGRAQGRTLKVLAENDGIKASELAKLLNLCPSSLSEKLQKLEEDGNIERVRDKKDLRVVRVFITEKGRETVQKRRNATKAAKRDFTDALSADELRVFLELCEKLTDNLDSIYLEEKKKRVEILKLQREIRDLDAQNFERDTKEKLG